MGITGSGKSLHLVHVNISIDNYFRIDRCCASCLVLGLVSTFAGSGAAGLVDGVGELASFHHPSDVACAPTGVFFVADFSSSTIRRIGPAGLLLGL